MIRLVVAASFATSAAACGLVEPRSAQMIVILTGSQEVPPTPSAGTGRGAVTFDRNASQIGWSIDYAGLSGPLHSAHFHGPALPGTNAPVAVPIPVTYSPLVGTAAITDAMGADLLAGRFYLNLHTPSYPNGEIRGQVVGPAPM